MTYALTFDIDWAPDEMIHDTVEVLRSFGLRATFFATHLSPAIDALDRDHFEVGLHPNFEVATGKYDFAPLLRLAEQFPESVGLRSHSLFFTSRLLGTLEMLGIEYEGNQFLLDHPGLMPTRRSEKLWSVPFNWSDDKHLELGRPWDLEALPNLHGPGLNVFNFHPVHVFQNSDSVKRYEELKKARSTLPLSDQRQAGEGVRTLFIRLCEFLSQRPTEVLRMFETIDHAP